MELPAVALPDYAERRSPWRRAAIVSAVIATLELVALVVIALAFVARPLADDSSAKSRSAKGEGAAAQQPASPAVPRSQTTVLVLNGNGVTGAAAQTARKLRRLDYSVTGIGDATRRDVPRTIVMYREGFEGEAVRLARDLGLGAQRAVPLDGLRAADLHGAALAVVIGG